MSTTTHQHEPIRITLPVEGMTCAACQANVQRALTATPGVAKAAKKAAGKPAKKKAAPKPKKKGGK